LEKVTSRFGNIQFLRTTNEVFTLSLHYVDLNSLIDFILTAFLLLLIFLKSLLKTEEEEEEIKLKWTSRRKFY